MPMLMRRVVFVGLLGAVAVALVWLCWRAVVPGGVTPLEWVALLAFVGVAPWLGISAANALIGLVILLGARDPVGAVLPAARAARAGARAPTIIAVCIRHEDMADITPPMRRLMAGLPADFTLWFLSDSSAPEAIAAEEAALREFPAARYRRRTDNTGFKAGNVMEFLDHHAGDARYIICLDADSEMSPAAVLRLVAIMEADQHLAIVQQLIVGRPTQVAFARLFQFGMRACMRAWAVGQAWWQGDAGPYWGHNAIIRIAPFRAHARLETLPDGRQILSHDQVEATRLTAAGWKVMLLPEEAGSLTGSPPALPELLARDRRWGAGNMQYWALLKLPGITPMGRWQLAQAMLLFAVAPLWAVVLAAAVLNVATGGAAGTDAVALATLMLAAWGAQNAPKLAGYAQVLAQPALAAAYGGRAHFARGAAVEILHGHALEIIITMNKAMLLFGLPFRRAVGWAAQNRAARGVGWRDAVLLLWPQVLVGLLCLWLAPTWWLLPWVLPLILSVPFCVLTAARLTGIGAIPEELQA